MGYDPDLETARIRPDVLAYGRALRDVLDKHKVRRIVSTRWLVAACLWLDAGHDFEDEKRRFFSGWKTDELRHAGTVKFKAMKRSKAAI